MAAPLAALRTGLNVSLLSVASLLVLVLLYNVNLAVSTARLVNVRNAVVKASQFQLEVTQLPASHAAFNVKLVPASPPQDCVLLASKDFSSLMAFA